jgi:hypothetical protein
MNLLAKIFLTALTAAAIFASLAASASARNFSLTNRNIRVVWTETNPFEWVIEALTAFKCRVTLEGSFHCATISKITEALVGYISRATTDQETCIDPSGNGVRVVPRQETLPWHIRYISFSGTLPRIRPRLRLLGVGMRLLHFPTIGNCNYRMNAEFFVTGPAGAEVTEGPGSVKLDEALSFNSETFGCPRQSLRSSSAAPLLLLGTTNSIRVRLT